jgi:hypothetical protein
MIPRPLSDEHKGAMDAHPILIGTRLGKHPDDLGASREETEPFRGCSEASLWRIPGDPDEQVAPRRFWLTDVNEITRSLDRRETDGQRRVMMRKFIEAARSPSLPWRRDHARHSMGQSPEPRRTCATFSRADALQFVAGIASPRARATAHRSAEPDQDEGRVVRRE